MTTEALRNSRGHSAPTKKLAETGTDKSSAESIGQNIAGHSGFTEPLGADRASGPLPRPGSRSLFGNFAWGAFGYLGFALCQWGMLVVLAKLGNPEMVGRFALGLAVTAPIVMFSNLQLQAVIRTDTRGSYQLGEYLGLRVITTTLAMVAIALAIVVVGYPKETALVILALGLAKSVGSISDVVEGFLQLHERMDWVTQSRMLKGTLSIVALGAAVYLTNSVFIGSIALFLAWLAVLIGFDMFNARRILRMRQPESGVLPPFIQVRPKWNRHQLKSLALLAFPLGIGALLSSLNTNVPRYVVERHMGETDLGIYAAMAYIMVAGSLVMQALGEPSSPRLAAYFDSGDLPAFRSLMLRLIGFGAICGLVGVVASATVGHLVLRLLYTDEFASQSSVLTLLAVAAGLNFVTAFLIYGLTAARRLRAQAPSNLIVVATTFGASMLLVPKYGLAGAAYAQIVAGVVSVAILGTLMFLAVNELSSTAYVPEGAES